MLSVSHFCLSSLTPTELVWPLVKMAGDDGEAVAEIDLSSWFNSTVIRRWARRSLNAAPPSFHSQERAALKEQLKEEEDNFRGMEHAPRVQRDDAAISIVQKRLILAPIRLLPRELFNHVCEFLPQIVLPKDFGILCKLMSVSSSWRRTIIGTSRLWAVIRVTKSSHVKTPQIKTWLARSKTRLLDVDLSTNGKKCPKPALGHILDQSARLQSLKLEFDTVARSPVWFGRFLAAMTTASSLTCLHLKRYGWKNLNSQCGSS